MTAASFVPGDKVAVTWIDGEREGVILRVERAKRSPRRFYVLELAGVRGHPSYEAFEMRHVL